MKSKDELECLYKASQSAHPAPKNIERKVQAHLRKKQKRSSIVETFNQWLPLASAVSVALFVAGLFWYQTKPASSFTQTIIDIEFHGFEASSQSPNSKYLVQKKRYLSDYMANKRSLEVASTRLVTIQSTDVKWVFKDCSNSLIQVSEQLMAQLEQESRINTNLAVGEHLEISLDRNGYILFLNETSAQMC